MEYAKIANITLGVSVVGGRQCVHTLDREVLFFWVALAVQQISHIPEKKPQTTVECQLWRRPCKSSPCLHFRLVSLF